MFNKFLNYDAMRVLRRRPSQNVRARISNEEQLINRVGDGLWVASGQLAAALGVLVGVRLLTEVIPPEVYGEVVLYAGLSTLAITIVGVPYSRGALLFYENAASLGLEEKLFGFVRTSVAKHLGLAIAVVLLFGLVYVNMIGGSGVVVVALAALLVVDCARTIEMAFLSAMKQQRRYAIWSILEAWSRPALAVVAVLVMGVKAEVVMVAYIVASGITLLCFVRGNTKPHREYSDGELVQIANLNERIKTYSSPLIPLGLVGWLGSMSDRYLLAALVGLHESGIYSAIFGLISRPFLLMQSISELTVRPVYFQAVTRNDRPGEVALLQRWLFVNCTVGLVLLVFCIVGSNLITSVLLGEAYSAGADLISYLAVGHLFLILGYSLNGYLYAHQHTKPLLWFDVCAVVLGLGLGAIAMYSFGIIGAASTCAVVFMARSVAVALYVYRKMHIGGYA